MEGGRGVSFLVVLWEQKKPSPALWECGKREAFSKGGGQRWKTGAERPSRKRWRFSTAVHGPAFPRRLGLRSLCRGFGDARQKLAFCSLHLHGSFGIGLFLGEEFQVVECYTGTQVTSTMRHFLE